MRKLKYVKLFENFQFQYFKPEVIKKLNDDLYGPYGEGNEEFDDINYLIEHWIEEIAKVIKSIEPFKNIEEMEVDSRYGGIKVDWNDYCCPFTIDISSRGGIESGHAGPGVYEEYESICINFSTEGPNGGDFGYPDVEDLSVEFKFSKGEDTGILYIDNWDEDVIPRLFRNIEKSIY